MEFLGSGLLKLTSKILGVTSESTTTPKYGVRSKEYGELKKNSSTETDEQLVQSFFDAAMNGDVITVDRLLREGMPVDVGMNGWTTLHRATLFNQNDVIKRLLHEGADVNSFDTRWEDTPLHKAAQWNYPEAVRLLLDNGANINLKNYDNETPLDVARKGSEVERLLLQVHQVKVHDKETNEQRVQSFFDAAMNGDVITVDRLLREGMPVDVGMNGWTTLHRATLFNRNDVIKRLLHEGADVNSFDTRWEDTPLHKAAQWNYPEAVRLLLDNGADINLKNYDNETPLDVARKGSKVERLLLQVHQVKVHDKGRAALPYSQKKPNQTTPYRI